jgi:hypothetical protein
MILRPVRPQSPTDDEASGRIDVVLRAFVQPLFRQHRLDDLFHDRFAQLVGRDVVAVLRREHYRLDGDRLVVFVTQGDLTLGVRTQPGEFALLAHLGLPLDEPMRERDRRRHQYIRFVGGETEHEALIARALFAGILAVNPLRDVRRLFADDVEDAA